MTINKNVIILTMFVKRLFILFLILTCACSTYTPQAPTWINTPIVNDAHWFGVGMVKKSFNGNVRETARNRAIEEIASQINIKISSSLKTIIEENNYDVNEFTKSVLKTRVDNSFENIDFSETYENRDSYYVLAKLSKSKYYEAQAQKKENAINTALSLIEKTESSTSISSIELLKEALNEIIQYMDNPIQVNYPLNTQTSKNLYSLIKTKTIELIENISILSIPDRIEIQSGWMDIDNKVIIETKNKISGDKLSNVPILILIESTKNISRITTNDQGVAEYLLSPNYKSHDYTYTIELKVDTEKLGLPYNYSNLSKTQVIVNHVPLNIYVNSIEKNLDKPIQSNLAEPLIKEYLSKNIHAEFTSEEEADLIIKFNINTDKKGDDPNEWGMYQTLGSGTLSVYNAETGVELFSKTSGNVGGAHFHSNETSGMDAIEEIVDKVVKENLQEMIDVLSKTK